MKLRKKSPGGLVEMSQLLEGVLQTLGVKGDFDQFRIEKKSREVLGEKVSKALVAVNLKGRVLEFAFNHSIWMNEVQFHKQEILQKLQREFPEIGIKTLALTLSRNSRT
jgi:hypothetical protein